MSRRYSVLVRQLLGEGLSQREVAAKLGITQASVSFYASGERNAKPDKIEHAIKKLRIRPEYFTDAGLGDAPSYRDFAGSTTSRDDEQGYPAVETYLARIAASGTPALPEHARVLRGLRLSGGPDSLTEEMVVGMHRGLIATDARRALEAPIAPEARIDEARGQRALPKRRR